MDSETQRSKTTEQGISYREFELVQEFAKAKLEAQSELQYEDLSDYQIPPRTQFSMLKKSAVSIKYREITFNTTCIRMFEGITNVLMSLSEKKQRLAVIMRKEEGSATVEWSRKKEDKYVNKTITSLEFTDAIYKLMNWDRNNRYKVLGRISNSAEGLILVFELEEAIMYDALPEEYVDRKTGELKKRVKVYYPEKYEGRIGNYYHDYVATEQLTMFENLDEYNNGEKQNADSTSQDSNSFADAMRPAVLQENSATQTFAQSGTYLGGPPSERHDE